MTMLIAFVDMDAEKIIKGHLAWLNYLLRDTGLYFSLLNESIIWFMRGDNQKDVWNIWSQINITCTIRNWLAQINVQYLTETCLRFLIYSDKGKGAPLKVTSWKQDIKLVSNDFEE